MRAPAPARRAPRALAAVPGRGMLPMALLLTAALLTACAAPGPEEDPNYDWAAERAFRPDPGPAQRVPDRPDSFRAELSGGQAPGCLLSGNAVHLGEGRFLTAAHLVDGIVPRLRQCAGAPVPTTIRYAGRLLPVRPLRVGEGYVEPGVGPLYRDGADLALLQARGAPPGPGARPCGTGPVPGQAVLVSSLAQPGAAAEAGALVPEALAVDGAYADIALSLAEGESGAGVFDARSHCLLGIVSHRPEGEPGHARIVPASTIRAFLDLPAEG